MPYSIAILAVAVAVLVLFSRPNTGSSGDATTKELSHEHEADIPNGTTHGTAQQLVTLTSEARYQTPTHQPHVLDVTVNLEDNVVTTLRILYDNHEPVTPQHKSFDAAIHDHVVGTDIKNLSLARVGGASLTTNAFNTALANIKTQLS